MDEIFGRAHTAGRRNHQRFREPFLPIGQPLWQRNKKKNKEEEEEEERVVGREERAE